MAGLTPEMISSALQLGYAGEKLGMQREQMDQERITDLVDMIYKGALTEQALAAAEKSRIPKDERTNAMKNYDFYKEQQSKLGKPTKPFETWDKDTRTGWQKDYDRYRSEGGEDDFHTWYRDVRALSGGLNLEEFTQRKEATEDVKRKSVVLSPEFVQTVTEDLMKDKTKWYSVEEASKLSTERNITFEQAQQMIQQRNTINEMGARIRQAFIGKEVEVRPDGWYIDGKLIRRNPYAK